MSVEVKELLLQQPIVDKDGKPTLELVEIIQRLVDAARDAETRLVALEP